jgi:hypothetical protein
LSGLTSFLRISPHGKTRKGPGEPPPRIEGAGIWALHVWLWKHNPSGMFADWNPNVTCKYAGS